MWIYSLLAQFKSLGFFQDDSFESAVCYCADFLVGTKHVTCWVLFEMNRFQNKPIRITQAPLFNSVPFSCRLIKQSPRLQFLSTFYLLCQKQPRRVFFIFTHFAILPGCGGSVGLGTQLVPCGIIPLGHAQELELADPRWATQTCEQPPLLFVQTCVPEGCLSAV